MSPYPNFTEKVSQKKNSLEKKVCKKYFLKTIFQRFPEKKFFKNFFQEIDSPLKTLRKKNLL